MAFSTHGRKQCKENATSLIFTCLMKYITKKCQTITYYGLKKKEIENFLISNNLKGIDRVVPIGSALEMDIIWDGYNMINSLSREITIYE